MTKQYDNFADLITFTRASTGTALRHVGYGAELVTNGTFDTDVSGWSAGSGSTLSSVSGQLVVSVAAGDTFGNAHQEITTVAGKVYQMTFDRVATTQQFFGGVATTATGSIDILALNSAGGVTGTFSGVFVGTGSNVFISAGVGDSNGGGSASFDNISVKEVIFDRATDPLVLFNHPTNTPRIEYDINGNRKGLLIEEARTNLLVQSGDLGVSPWTAINVTTSVDASTAPNGSDMTLLTSTGVDADTAAIQNTTSSAGTTYTASVFVRRDQHRFAILFGFGNGGTGVVFDLVLGTAQVNGSWVSAGIDIISPTIARIYGVVTPVLSNAGLYVGLASTINGDKFFSGGEALSFWGAQLEQASFPTSYIPTAGAAATRAADAASIPTSAFGYNADKGTVVVEVETSIYSGAVTSALWGMSNGTTAEVVYQGVTRANNNLRLQSRSNSTIDVDFYSGVFQPVGVNKMAAVIAANDFAMFLNGTAVGTDVSAVMPKVNMMEIGDHQFGGLLNGHIKYIQYYPRRLTNAQIVRLTS
jgi:hypothetical protein